MKIGIQTWGSEGDVRPLIALGGGLQSAGHDVTVVVTSVDNKDYSSLCRNLGLKYSRAPERIDYDLTTLVRYSGCNNAQVLKATFDELFNPYLAEIHAASKHLCETNDLVIGHFFVFPLKAAALMTGKPHVSVTLYPGMIPSSYRAPDGMPQLGRIAARLQWELAQRILDALLKKKVSELWEKHGLSPFRHVLTDILFSDNLNLLAASPLLWSRLPDWEAKHRLCGFFDMPVNVEPWTVPASLHDFLAGGEPPVYMTLGSPQQLDPQRSMDLLVVSAKKIGCRTLIQTTSGRYPEGHQEKNIYFAGHLPHSFIFPRCAAVVHHGGAGTTHSAAKAGCPSVVVGFMDEQLAWGKHLYSLGVAAPPLQYRNVTSGKLTKTLQYVLNNSQLRRKAEEVGKIMQQENGVAGAIEHMHAGGLLS